MIKCKSKAMLFAVLVVLLLVMTAIWLCFFHGDEAKEPDGTLDFSITREVAARVHSTRTI